MRKSLEKIGQFIITSDDLRVRVFLKLKAGITVVKKYIGVF